jgi:hypothetical protein
VMVCDGTVSPPGLRRALCQKNLWISQPRSQARPNHPLGFLGLPPLAAAVQLGRVAKLATGTLVVHLCCSYVVVIDLLAFVVLVLGQ